MDLKQVHQGIHSRKARKRVGRGPASGHGKTASHGHKGQKSRSGSMPHQLFEGGQMPIGRRLPKRGFVNSWAKLYAIVNVSQLDQKFQDGDKVDPEKLREAGLVRGRCDGVKILGDGTIQKKLTVVAHRFSKSAQQKITQAGGSAELVG